MTINLNIVFGFNIASSHSGPSKVGPPPEGIQKQKMNGHYKYNQTIFAAIDCDLRAHRNSSKYFCMTGKIMTVYLLRDTPILKPSIYSLLPTPYPPLHLLHPRWVCDAHWALDILMRCSDVPVIFFDSLTKRKV